MTVISPSARRPTIEDIVGDMTYLAPAPRVLPRLERLLMNPNSSMFEIVELVHLDAALTSKVIHMSNSVAFGRGAACQTLPEAVNRVGFRRVHQVVATAAAATLVQRLDTYGLPANEVWRESVICAFAAEALAARIGEEAQSSYIIGLLHGVGRMAINHYLVGRNQSVVLENKGFPDDFSADEITRVGVDQASVGAEMMREWDFRSRVVDPIRWQYRPLQAPRLQMKMAAVLHGARFLSAVLCAGGTDGQCHANSVVLAGIKMTETELLGLLPELSQALLRARQLTELH